MKYKSSISRGKCKQFKGWLCVLPSTQERKILTPPSKEQEPQKSESKHKSIEVERAGKKKRKIQIFIQKLRTKDNFAMDLTVNSETMKTINRSIRAKIRVEFIKNVRQNTPFIELFSVVASFARLTNREQFTYLTNQLV